MSPLRTHLTKSADIRDQAVNMILKHEGRPGKITKDTGGTTNAGIAESGGEFTAEQIKKLSPAQVRGYWGDKWDSTGARFPAPGAGLAYFDAQANAGPGRATRWVQEAVGVKPDGKFGSGTQQALDGADQQQVTRHLINRFQQHHQGLVRDNPAKFGKYSDGWANRRQALRKDPLVAQMLAPRPQGQATPQPDGSVLAKGAPSPGLPLLIDTVPPAAPPVLVKGQLQTPQASPPVQGTTPGGPIPSLPMLSAPVGQKVYKQASALRRLFTSATKAVGNAAKAHVPLPRAPVPHMAPPRLPATRLPQNHDVPQQYVADIEDALAANSRVHGSQGFGAIKSVDDVTRKNPNLRYMGSAESRLPGAQQHGTGVVDYFQAGVDDMAAVGGRPMSPMVMRQRYRTGYDPAGKAVYDPGNVDVMMQPMYVSSGAGSGASSAGRWVPFSEVHAPANAAEHVKRLHAQNSYYKDRLPVSPSIAGTSGDGSWIGKYVNDVGSDGRMMREALVHNDDIAAGYGRYSKESLPPHLEAAQGVLNDFYGMNKQAADLSKMYAILARAAKVKGSLGSDAADRITTEQLGSVFGIARKRFFNQASSLGITSRTPHSKIQQLLTPPVATPAIPVTPATPVVQPRQALMPFMDKQAAKWDAMLRAGKIGKSGMGQLRRMFISSGAVETTVGGHRIGISPYNMAILDVAEQEKNLRAVRAGMARSHGGGMIPASDAYAAVDRSAVQRLAALKGMPTAAYANLPDAQMLRANRAHFNAPVSEAGRVPRPRVGAAPTTEGRMPKFAWGSGDLAPGSSANYSIASNVVHAPVGKPMMRHELGHYAQNALALENPMRLHTRTLSDFRRLEASSPQTAYNMLSTTPGKNVSIPAVEFQAHALAARGNGGGARMRAATNAGVPEGPVGDFFSRVGNHPINVGHPEIQSGFEHLIRNYGVPSRRLPDFRDRVPRYIRKQASLASHLRAARNKTHTHPTPGQASAGNYAKGSLILHGMHIKLENPSGTERRGYDKDGNVTWKRTMRADYGYFYGTKAIDGDAVDCFIGPDLDSHFVAAVDQVNSDGSFDETKFVLGCSTQEHAEKLYLAHYPRGWKLGPVSTTTVQQLKTWLKEGDTKAPFKGQLVKAARARWRDPRALEALWSRLGLKKDPFSGFGEIGLARSKHQLADQLQGAKPGRMDTAVAKLTERLGLRPAPNFGGPGDVVYRGVNPHSLTSDLFFGGGYYNGALQHGSPLKEVAKHYGRNSGAEGRLNVVTTYKPHPRQSYGGNFSVEHAVEGRGTRLTHNAAEPWAYETAVAAQHNEPLGVLVGPWRGGEGFMCPGDKKSTAALAGFLGEMAGRGGAPQTKYIMQGGRSPHVTPASIDRSLFSLQPGTPEATSDTEQWLRRLSHKLHANPASAAMLEKHPVKMLEQHLRAKQASFKAAALRPDKWERLCVRRGQCPDCRKPNCEGNVCDCGKTLSNDEWKDLRDKAEAGTDLRTKQASFADVVKSLKPYAKATKEVFAGSKLPPMEEALKGVPAGTDNLTRVLPRLGKLLRFSLGRVE